MTHQSRNNRGVKIYDIPNNSELLIPKNDDDDMQFDDQVPS